MGVDGVLGRSGMALHGTKNQDERGKYGRSGTRKKTVQRINNLLQWQKEKKRNNGMPCK
jgi:hypothetical protein